MLKEHNIDDLPQPWLVRQTVGRFVDRPARLLNPRWFLGKTVPALMRNLPGPTFQVDVDDYSSDLSERPFPTETRQRVIDATQDWEIGQSRGKVMLVGKVDTGAAHPHLYEVKKQDGGVRLMLVDPESNIGRRNRLKAPVIHIIAAKINDQNLSTNIDYLTFRSDFLDEPKTHLPNQYRLAEEVVASPDGLPQVLREHPEAILFRLSTRPDFATLQARFIRTSRMTEFLKTAQGPMPLWFTLDHLEYELSYMLGLLRNYEQNSSQYESILRKAA